MADRAKGMGRGLAAILAVAPRDGSEELRQVPLELIEPNPHQPRQTFDQEGLVALADSIRLKGLLQPVLVRPLPGGRYELIAGERRWRAAKLAGLELIPALVRHHDDAASLELALVENMARQDLNPVEEARACAALVDELALTREEVGLRIGRSRVAVSNLIRLLDLPDEALELLERGVLSEGHGRALLASSDHMTRRTLARLAAENQWSVRELEAQARAKNEGRGRLQGRAGVPSVDAERRAAAGEIADTLEPILGREVQVKPSAEGYRVHFVVESTDDARELSSRLRIRLVA